MQGKPIEELICFSFKICVAMFVFLSGYGVFISVRKQKNVSKVIAAESRVYLCLSGRQ